MMAGLEELKHKTRELLDDGHRAGQLTDSEYSWRQTHLTQAKSVEELEALVDDLLEAGAVAGNRSVETQHTSRMTLMANRSFVVADLARKSEIVTIMGSSRVDLRSLSAEQPLTLEVVTIMGDLTIEVPEGVTVRVEATPVMGDCHVDASLRTNEGLVKIVGIVLMGSLRVVRAKKVVSG